MLGDRSDTIYRSGTIYFSRHNTFDISFILSISHKDLYLTFLQSGDIVDFDDFGNDSCVVQDEIVRQSYVELKRKNICDKEKEKIAVSR